MVEPTVAQQEWSVRTVIFTALALAVVAAGAAAWFWATDGVSVAHRGSYPADAMLDGVSDGLMLAFFLVAIPTAYFWIRGRRRAEAEADRAGLSIKDAQDEYDGKPRPLVSSLLYAPPIWGASAMLPKVLELADQQLWLKTAVAGLVIGAPVALILWNFLCAVRAALATAQTGFAWWR